MAIDYKTLIGDVRLEYSIKNLCNDSRVPSAGILQEAQQWIYQRLRVRQMLKTATDLPLAISTDSITLPADWQYPYFLMFTPSATSPKSIPKFKHLERVVSEWSYDSAGTRLTGRPDIWATDEGKIQFEKVADKEYATHIIYYAHKTLLGPNNTTNFLTDRYLSLLRAACLRFAYEHLQNTKMMTYYSNQAEALINQANVDSDLQLEGMELQVSIGSEEDTYL